MKSFLLPDLGEGLHEAEIVTWHVKVGDEVTADDPLLSVETEKAVVEVPAPWTGRIARLCAAVGERVAVGAPVVDYAGDGIAVAAAPRPVAASANPARPSVALTDAGHRTRAMPAVRILAQELGVDLAGLTGTGPDGAITARDVAIAFKGAAPAAAAALPPAGFTALTGPRRSMAEAMVRAREVMPATVTEDCDVGSWGAGTGVLLRLVRAVCRAAAAEPALNAWFDAKHGRRLHDRVDLGLAVDTPAGLFVPVIRNAGALAPDALAAEIARLIAGAQGRTLPPEDLRGATITLSNYGSIAGRHATPVVLPPQVAILGAGRIYQAVCLTAGKPSERPTLPLSLTIDHRAVTGGESARFLAAVMMDLAAAT